MVLEMAALPAEDKPVLIRYAVLIVLLSGTIPARAEEISFDARQPRNIAIRSVQAVSPGLAEGRAAYAASKSDLP